MQFHYKLLTENLIKKTTTACYLQMLSDIIKEIQIRYQTTLKHQPVKISPTDARPVFILQQMLSVLILWQQWQAALTLCKNVIPVACSFLSRYAFRVETDAPGWDDDNQRRQPNELNHAQLVGKQRKFLVSRSLTSTNVSYIQLSFILSRQKVAYENGIKG